MWPNLLSLDAPAIAVAWQLMLARSIAPVDTAVTVVLAISIWLVYTADRLLDTHIALVPPKTPRHGFTLRYWRGLAATGILLLALDLWIAAHYLPASHWRTGLLLLVAVAIRFLAIRPLAAAPWGKDLLTALIFAAGVWLPFLALGPPTLDALLFVLLCWWNCRAIDAWETGLFGPDLTFSAAALTALCLSALLVTMRPERLAATISSAGFVALAAGGPLLSINQRRAAVDFFLLSPLLLHGC